MPSRASPISRLRVPSTSTVNAPSAAIPSTVRPLIVLGSAPTSPVRAMSIPIGRRSSKRGYPACVVCGEPTQHTQRTTCPQHRRGQAVREIATCPCGQPAANIRSKYCSDEHRKKWGRKPPVEMVTKTCLACGEEFTRPWYFPGKLKYCSNKCAHIEVKKVRDKFIADLPVGAVVFKSGWEVRFAAVCMRLDIDWRRYDGPDIETSQGIYRPDFIVGPDSLIIEVKGWEERPGTPEKLAESGVLVIGKAHLEILEGCSYADTFWRAIEIVRGVVPA